MSKVRICFLGTPDFAVACLKKMLEDEHFEIVGVVTQPDRPAGRKLQLMPSPVKSLAQAKGLRVISPESVNQPLILQEIQKWGAEVAVVVAFGQILSNNFLDLFRLGAVNVHGSLLPKWRGAAPIQRSLEAGETETGVALQKVVKKLDAGDVLGVRRLQVTDDMTALDVHDKLAELGGDLLHVELMDYVRGNLVGEPQNHDLATHAKKIDKAECQLNWNLTAREIFNKTRGYAYGPGAWILVQGKKLKLHKLRVVSEDAKADPGRVLEMGPAKLVIGTGKGSIELLEVQPESRNRMPVADFVKSLSVKQGDVLG